MKASARRLVAGDEVALAVVVALVPDALTSASGRAPPVQPAIQAVPRADPKP
jgi:hypothetical protein